MGKPNFPLQWPVGWKRTVHQSWSKFKPGSAYAGTIDLIHQLEMLGATDIVITSNMQYRTDGLPYSRQSITDSGVAAYFKLDGEEQCIPCDKWVKVEENIRAIVKTIEALRGLERWGAKEMVNAAFRGFKALPSAIVTPAPHQPWYVVLDVNPGANAQEVKAAYRDAIKLHHPDAGGSPEDFKAIQQAYEDWKSS